jgi:hypothetical protein
MRTLKIRFVERDNKYTIQHKKWFGWKDLTYTIDMGYGAIVNYYENKNKESLLNEVLEEKFNTVKKFVEIIEYPTIKVY